MQIGTLITEVFASRARLPIEGANVFVTKDDDSEVLGVRRTDVVGKTVPLEIEAPDAVLSEEPMPAAVHPYTEVNVYVQKDEYYNILVRGVQIFGGQLSLQRVQMIPLPANYTGDRTEIITITPQDL